MSDFKFPRDIKPRQDLWPGIEQAINNTAPAAPKHSRWPGAGIAAAALVVVAVLLTQGELLRTTPQIPTFDADADFASYEQQKQNLLVAYGDQPALTSNWQDQLAELEMAAQSLRDAIKQDPNNAVLIHMLNNVYQQQLKLIQKVHAPRWQNI